MTTNIHQPKLSRRAALAAAGTLGSLGITVAAGAESKATPGAKAPKPTLAFRPDGAFKIVQFNDTQDDEQTDRRTIELMDRTLDAEKPDFVVINGDVINGVPITLRRAEILALLASRTQGWSAEELAYQLHGEDGAAATIRTEMHRIRSVLGAVVEPNPYRFAAGVRVVSDADVVAGHLRAGRLGEALAAYPARLLNRSTNLTVELMRDDLNEAVAASVRSSGDAEMISRWCASDMGSGDIAAAAALARLTGPADARFQLVRARMERIDRELRA